MGNISTNNTPSDTIDFDELDIHELNSEAALHKNDPLIRKTKEYQLLRNTARQGVPLQKRETFWRKATHANENDVIKYQELIKDIFEGVPMKEFPKFSKNFFGSTCTFPNLGKEQKQACARILLILAVEHDSLKYCPQLPYVTELMIGFAKESVVFALCHAMIGISKKNNWYFRTDFINFHIRLRTFERVFMENVKVIVNHVDNIGIDIDDIVSEGYSSMWVAYLDGLTFLRMVDCFLVEGYKVLFRVGVALLQYATNELLETNTLDEFKEALIKKSHQLTPEELSKIAFKIYLTRDQFEKLDQLHQQELSIDEEEHRDEMVRRWPSFNKEWLKESQILKSKADILQLWVWLPEGCHHGDLSFLFATHQHGYKLSTLYFNCQDRNHLLILIETTNEEVIGVYVTTLGNAPSTTIIREPKLRAFILRTKNRIRECYEPVDMYTSNNKNNIVIQNNNNNNNDNSKKNNNDNVNNDNNKVDKNNTNKDNQGHQSNHNYPKHPVIQRSSSDGLQEAKMEKLKNRYENTNNNANKNKIVVTNEFGNKNAEEKKEVSNDKENKDEEKNNSNDLLHLTPLTFAKSTPIPHRRRSSSLEEIYPPKKPQKKNKEKSPRITFKTPKYTLVRLKSSPQTSRSLSPPRKNKNNNNDNDENIPSLDLQNLETDSDNNNNNNNNNNNITIQDKKKQDNFPIIIADKKDLRIGDGESDIIYIDENLNHGRTCPCNILQSPSLVNSQFGEFQIKHVELWCVDW